MQSIMTGEQIAWLISCAVAVMSIITPIVRLNASVARLTASLEALVVRLEKTETRLDEHNVRLMKVECGEAALNQSVEHVGRLIDSLDKRD